MHRRNILRPPFHAGRSDWSPWRAMDASVPVHAVTCTTTRDGVLTVYAMTADGGLIRRSYPDESGHWADWQVLATPGHITALAGSRAGESDSLAVVTRGGTMAIRPFARDWLPCGNPAGIASVAWADIREAQPELYGLTTDGRVFNRMRTPGQQWVEIAGPGGKCVSIAIGYAAAGLVRMVVARDDGSAHIRATGWSDWVLAPSESAIRALACSSMNDRHVSLFATTDEGKLLHRQAWRSEPWTDWVPLDD
jgi:hypothetical protein